MFYLFKLRRIQQAFLFIKLRYEFRLAYFIDLMRLKMTRVQFVVHYQTKKDAYIN